MKRIIVILAVLMCSNAHSQGVDITLYNSLKDTLQKIEQVEIESDCQKIHFYSSAVAFSMTGKLPQAYREKVKNNTNIVAAIGYSCQVTHSFNTASGELEAVDKEEYSPSLKCIYDAFHAAVFSEGRIEPRIYTGSHNGECI